MTKWQSQDYFKSLLDMDCYGILIYTIPDYTIQQINAEALRLGGFADLQEAQANFRGILQNAIFSDDLTVQELKELRNHDGPITYECVLCGKNGIRNRVQARTVSVTNPQGQRVIITTFIDISNNKALIRERSVLDAITVDYSAIFYVNLDKNTIYAVKQDMKDYTMHALQVLGGDFNEYATHMHFFYENYVVQESAPDFPEKVSKAFLQSYLANHERFAYRFQCVPAPEGHRYFDMQVVRLKTEEDFCVVMGFRYIDDLVEAQEQQKKALEDAYQEEANKNEVIEALAEFYECLCIVDLVRREYVVVSGKDKGFPYPESLDSFQDTVLQKYIRPEFYQDLRAFTDFDTLSQRLLGRKIISTDLKATNGKWYTLSFIVKKCDEHGTVTHVLMTIFDIDEQKSYEVAVREKLKAAAQEAERANMAKTNFLRRMSHDIRTPLNGIIGMIKLSDQFYSDKEKLRVYKEKVLSSLDYLQTILNDILDMSKVESETIIMEEKPFDLVDVLTNVVSVIETSAANRGLTFHGGKDLSTIRHRYFLGSTEYLNRLLMNVTSNAVKYNRPGGSVTIYCRELSCDGNVANYEFVCADTGYGMSKEFQAHAFEPFVREKREATSGFTGTGLGLAIVKDIVKIMGGTIFMDSQENVGTTFTVNLPLKIDPNPRISKKTGREKLNLSGKTALLVEDNDINLEISQILLESMGLTVKTARNGREAVETFENSKEGTFRYIFMDIMMPVMNGLEAAKAIRCLNRPDAKTTPIIAMTANAFREDIQECQNAGMNAHVAKPIDEGKLEEAIRDL